jgi:hypothetical protein
MNEWKGVLVFNKEMVQNMPSYKCMHVEERKKGRGEGFVVVLRMWFTWSPMSQIDGCSPPPKTTKPKSINFIRLLCISQKA